MNLRDQMAIDACAYLNTDELGERATWTKYGTTNAIQRTVRLIEQGDIQTIRRAHIWTEHKGTTATQGDTFRVKRGAVTTTWRVMYTDPAETALQRSYCHLQLTDTMSVVNKWRVRKPSGADSHLPQEVGTSYRCQWFDNSAEMVVENRKRLLQGEWYCMLEVVPDLKTDLTLLDSDGRPFRVERLERPFNRQELPYLICTRSDI